MTLAPVEQKAIREVNYGGVWIKLGSLAFIFDAWASRPVFHRGELRGSYIVTLCGIPTRDRPGGYASAVCLPPRHARRFARPCRKCWPELRGSTLELLAGRLP